MEGSDQVVLLAIAGLDPATLGLNGFTSDGESQPIAFGEPIRTKGSKMLESLLLSTPMPYSATAMTNSAPCRCWVMT
jgi:hypothetical protein